MGGPWKCIAQIHAKTFIFVPGGQRVPVRMLMLVKTCDYGIARSLFLRAGSAREEVSAVMARALPVSLLAIVGWHAMRCPGAIHVTASHTPVYGVTVASRTR